MRRKMTHYKNKDKQLVNQTKWKLKILNPQIRKITKLLNKKIYKKTKPQTKLKWNSWKVKY